MSSRFNNRRRRAGTAALELALVIAPFLWMMLAVIDLGRYLFTAQSMVAVMNQAQRNVVMLYTSASVNGSLTMSSCDSPTSWPDTASIAPMLDASTTVCHFNVTGGLSLIQSQIIVTTPFVAITPGIGALPGLGTLLNGTMTVSTIYTM